MAQVFYDASTTALSMASESSGCFLNDASFVEASYHYPHAGSHELQQLTSTSNCIGYYATSSDSASAPVPATASEPVASAYEAYPAPTDVDSKHGLAPFTTTDWSDVGVGSVLGVEDGTSSIVSSLEESVSTGDNQENQEVNFQHCCSFTLQF